MIKAYIDDSGVRQPPLYVLAGWAAPTKIWAPFADAWNDVLRMSPRIGYFKLEEALNFKGEFQGISEARRNEKLNLLVEVVSQCDLLGFASLLPHNLFQHFFVRRYSNPNAHIPFIPLAYSVMAVLMDYLRARRVRDKIEFVFDYQPGSNQMAKVQEMWEEMRATASPEISQYLSIAPPQFLDDKDVLPLQAADLIAGWKRLADLPAFGGKETPKPWTRVTQMMSINRAWDPIYADRASRGLFGPPDKP